MEIFGIGLPEVLLIAVVALIVMGPDRLPEAARTLGKAVYDFRKAIEPARSAWEDVQKQISTGFDLQSSGSGSAPVPGAPNGTAPAASGNPWTVHPITKGFSEEEFERFFKTGEIPEWKRVELADLETKYRNGNGSNGAAGDTHELSELDYPVPHAQVPYEPAPSHTQLEELDYPEPGNTKEEGQQV